MPMGMPARVAEYGGSRFALDPSYNATRATSSVYLDGADLAPIKPLAPKSGTTLMSLGQSFKISRSWEGRFLSNVIGN